MKAVILLIFVSLPALAEVVDRLAAIVNTEAILESDLRRIQASAGRAGVLQPLLMTGKKAQDIASSSKAAMDYLIDQSIINSEIKRLNLSVTQERVNQEIRDKAKENRVSVPEMMQAIAAQGMKASEYQDFLKSHIEMQSLVQSEVISKIHISDDDVLAEYSRRNPKNPTAVYEYKVAHMVFNARKGGEAAALERAKEALAKLRGGESFETLAEQRSEDDNFTNGGLLGTVRAGDLAREMDQALMRLSPGEISQVVRVKSSLGVRFHILHLLEKKLVSDERFDKEKNRIRGEMMERLFAKAFLDWLRAKKEESFIRINKPS